MTEPTSITQHLQQLKNCHRCPKIAKPGVTGEPVISKLLLLGQAPGIKEPQFGRPFAWTAGKTMFQWFESYWAVDKATFRQRVYMSAVCRCYPGKNPQGGDRVPDQQEIENCSGWLRAEFEILQPQLVLAVGKLAIQQFMPCNKLADVVSQIIRVKKFGYPVDVIALPHPSGVFTWHRMEPGKTYLGNALNLAKTHSAFVATFVG